MTVQQPGGAYRLSVLLFVPFPPARYHEHLLTGRERCRRRRWRLRRWGVLVIAYIAVGGLGQIRLVLSHLSRATEISTQSIGGIVGREIKRLHGGQGNTSPCPRLNAPDQLLRRLGRQDQD